MSERDMRSYSNAEADESERREILNSWLPVDMKEQSFSLQNKSSFEADGKNDADDDGVFSSKGKKGVVFCRHCYARYTAEQMKCPYCGMQSIGDE